MKLDQLFTRYECERTKPMETKIYFYVGKVYKWIEEDVYESGCIAESATDCDYKLNLKCQTIDEILTHLQNHFDCKLENMELNACGEDGRIDIQIMEDSHGNPAWDVQIAAWKSGKCRLWNAIYTVRVKQITETSVRITKPKGV